MLKQNEQFASFWAERFSRAERRVAVVAGLGFDPRACIIFSRLLEAGGQGDRDLWLICYENAQADAEALMPAVRQNDEEFVRLIAGRGQLFRHPLRMRGEDGRLSSGPQTQQLVRKFSGLMAYADVVVDISAMPRMIALTLMSRLIDMTDQRKLKGEPSPNLHFAVAESVSADNDTAEEGIEETVVHVPGFTGRIGAESADNPKIWLPVLGEGQRIRLQRIYDKILPDEVCPVIPFPSRSPRRGDSLIEEYRQILFDEYRVDPRNIVYASEFNPFEAYRQIFDAIKRYRASLGELGACRAVVSPLSSKLLSIGTLLAAHDHARQRNGQFHVGVHYVEAGSYRPSGRALEVSNCDVSGMWVVGDWENE